MRQRRLIIGSVILPLTGALLMPFPALSDSQESTFYDNVEWAKSVRSEAYNDPDMTLNFSDFCPDDNPGCESDIKSPPEAGMTDAQISDQATTAFYNNENAMAIQDNFNNNSYTLDPNDETYRFATLGIDNAYEITHGQSNQFVDCDSGQMCLDKNTPRTCTSPTYNDVPCHQTPNFTSVSLAQKQQDFSATTSQLNNFYYYPTRLTAPDDVQNITGVMMPRLSQTALINTPTTTDYRINGVSVYSTVNGDNCKTIICFYDTPPRYIKLPEPIPVTAGSQIRIETVITNLNGVQQGNAWWSINTRSTGTIYYSQPHYEYEWVSSCQSALPGCTATNQQICVEGKETRTINGVDITLDCWKYEQTYQCDTGNTCDALAQCTEDARECSLTINGVCIEETLSKTCTTKECSATSLQCGEESFCLDGDCFEPMPTTDDSFDESASALAALAEAADGIGDPPMIFTGKAMQCTDKAFGFADCCKDSGWGTSLGLDQCNEEEVALGQAKEQGITVSLGSYCASSFLGSCTRKKRSYCVFDNKLARIIQEQGVKGQLGVSLGSAKSPVCGAITPEQLQEIDFELLDFTDFYGDMHDNTNVPSEQEIKDRITSTYDNL